MSKVSRAYRSINILVAVLLLWMVLAMTFVAAAAVWMKPIPLARFVAREMGLVPAISLGVLVGVASIAAAFFVGLGGTRTLSRLVPLTVTGTPDRTGLKLASFAVLGTAPFVWFFAQLAFNLAAGHPTDDLIVLLPAASALVSFGISIAIVSRRHRRPLETLAGPFVVFLRRFSTYSDRVVLGECLRACPNGVPLALLVPTDARIRDWNPVSLAFAGYKLVHPVSSLPLFFRTDDADWEAAARDLVVNADRIVLDLSDQSSSIATEIRMITEAGRWPDVIALVEQRTDSSVTSITEGAAAGHIVEYRRVWQLRQLFFGLFVSATAAGGLLMSFDELLGPPTAVLEVMYAATVVTLFLVFFLRPGMSKEGARALQDALSKRGTAG
jgi:PAS domain-containing protein